MIRRILALGATAAFLASCHMLRPQPQPQLSPQDRFWSELQTLCGGSFRGELGEGQETDFTSGPIIAEFGECGPGEIAITVRVGEDRSRRWVFNRTGSGLRLTHHHDRADEDILSGYGGSTVQPGGPGRQEFVADAATRKLLPAAADNVWAVEIVPGSAFIYSVHRQGTDRRLTLSFDLRALRTGRSDPGPLRP